MFGFRYIIQYTVYSIIRVSGGSEGATGQISCLFLYLCLYCITLTVADGPQRAKLRINPTYCDVDIPCLLWPLD